MRKFLIFLFALLLGLNASSQCPTCDPDVSCVSADGQPTVCPLELPPATAGEYYQEVLTFYLPTSFVEPSLDVTVTLTQITISSVTGLPYGLTFTTNDPDGIYYPSQGENYGCATICGTPLLPGTYTINVNVAVIAEVFGFEVTDNQTFTNIFTVVPGEGGNASFTFDNQAGCGEVGVQFNAIIAGTSSQVTTYAWDFGNGATSEEPNPFFSYTQAGQFTASLTTTIEDIMLSTVVLSNINDNGEGDVDEFFSGPADPYFIMTDASGTVVYTSAVVDNTTTTSWTDLNIPLTNPPYTIAFWDDDTVTSDDLLSTFTLPSNEGETAFNSGDGTVGSFVIGLFVSTNVTESSDIVVFPIPSIDLSLTGNTISATGDGISSYQWFFEGNLIDGATFSTYNPTQGGNYSCYVVNEFGCDAMSNEILYCAPVNLIFDPVANELYVDNIYTSYDWYYNGLPLAGADSYVVVSPAPGNYMLIVTTDYGCEIESSVTTVVNSIGEIDNSISVSLYPNPAIQYLNIQSEVRIDSFTIFDVTGKVVLQNNTIARNFKQVDISPLNEGTYFISLSTAEGVLNKKFIKSK
ncbi:MAG: T9SS type A sorting domain-containing protein [Flavobacteriales bacterium]